MCYCSSNVDKVEQIFLGKPTVVIPVCVLLCGQCCFVVLYLDVLHLSSTKSTPRWERSTEKDVVGKGRLMSFSRPIVCVLVLSHAASNAAAMVLRKLDVWAPILCHRMVDALDSTHMYML